MTDVPVLKADENFERLMIRLRSVTQGYTCARTSLIPVYDAMACRLWFGKRKVSPRFKHLI